MNYKYIRCDNVGTLRHLLEEIPDEAFILVNGKKAKFRDDASTGTVYLESDEAKLPCSFDF